MPVSSDDTALLPTRAQSQASSASRRSSSAPPTSPPEHCSSVGASTCPLDSPRARCVSATPTSDAAEELKVPPPSPASSSCGEPEEDHSAVDCRVTVQFKWGRCGDYHSSRPLQNGDCVIVDAAMNGDDLGMVTECTLLQAGDRRPARAVRRLATDEELVMWRGVLVDREKQALRAVVGMLPENRVGFRVVHVAHQFDLQVLTLHYTVSARAKPNILSHVPALQARFQCHVEMQEYTLMEQDARNRALMKQRAAIAAAPLPIVPVDAAAAGDDPLSPHMYSQLHDPRRVGKAVHSRGESFDTVVSHTTAASSGSCGLSSLASDDAR